MPDLYNNLNNTSNHLTDEDSAVLNAVMIASNDAIITKDVKGTITDWNPAAELLFGYDKNEAIGQPITLIIPKQRFAEDRYITSLILQGKKIERFETKGINRDGAELQLCINVSPILNNSGAIIGALQIARDISERQLANEKQAILAAIVATSDDAIVSKTLQGVITSWNHSAEKMFGYTEAEAIGKHISLIIPPERLGEEDFIIGEIAKGRKVDHFETVRRTKDGRDIHISVRVSPVIDPDGKVIGASKVARDISATKQFAQKQGMLAAIIGSSDDTIVSKTLDGKITSWNRAAERMFGYTESEALGQHISLIIPQDRLNEETYIIGQVSKGNKVDHFETLRLAKDGRLIPISLSVSPIVDDNGQIIGASKIARDISEQVATQQEKARLYDEIKALNDKKDEFIGLASHELKTPLTSIQGYLQILNGNLNEERRKDFLHKALQQVKKLNNLVSDLLDISKIQRGELRYNFAKFDLCQVTRDAIELIASANEAFNVKFESRVKSVTVNGDAQRIEQVIINLLTNAIRYSSNSRHIEVSLSVNAERVTIAVRDWGLGIPENQLEQIFTRFYRVGENKNIGGLGLGLYLSQQIINRHKGKIWAESKQGEGSTFYITIPMETAHL